MITDQDTHRHINDASSDSTLATRSREAFGADQEVLHRNWLSNCSPLLRPQDVACGHYCSRHEFHGVVSLAPNKLYHSSRPASRFSVHAQLNTVTVTVLQLYSIARVTALQCYKCYYLFSRASIHLETCGSGRGSGTMREGLHARMTACIYMYVYICTL